jgi:hypothetical protein
VPSDRADEAIDRWPGLFEDNASMLTECRARRAALERLAKSFDQVITASHEAATTLRGALTTGSPIGKIVDTDGCQSTDPDAEVSPVRTLVGTQNHGYTHMSEVQIGAVGRTAEGRQEVEARPASG